MSLVRNKGSKAEMTVRRMTHSLGYRYRLHVRDLPGKPDLVFRSRKKVIFVHGCFWHRHPGCKRTRFPKSPETADRWKSKLLGNAQRDKRIQKEILDLGWKFLVIWECEAENKKFLEKTVTEFLG